MGGSIVIGGIPSSLDGFGERENPSETTEDFLGYPHDYGNPHILDDKIQRFHLLMLNMLAGKSPGKSPGR